MHLARLAVQPNPDPLLITGDTRAHILAKRPELAPHFIPCSDGQFSIARSRLLTPSATPPPEQFNAPFIEPEPIPPFGLGDLVELLLRCLGIAALAHWMQRHGYIHPCACPARKHRLNEAWRFCWSFLKESLSRRP